MPAPLQEELGAVRVQARRLELEVRLLERPVVPPDPVPVVRLHVVVLRELLGPGARNPCLARTVADLDRELKVARLAPHPVAPAQQRERGREVLRIVAALRERHGSGRDVQRPVHVLGPHRAAPLREERLDLRMTGELGHQRAQLALGARVVLELGHGQTALQQDRASLVIRAREVERSRVELPCLLDRQGVRRSPGCLQQVGDRARRLAGLAPVVGQDPSELVGVGHRPFEMCGRRGVQLAT